MYSTPVPVSIDACRRRRRLSVTTNASLGSTTVSPIVVTLTAAPSAPAGIVTVPEPATTSAPVVVTWLTVQSAVTGLALGVASDTVKATPALAGIAFGDDAAADRDPRLRGPSVAYACGARAPPDPSRP